MMVSVQACLRDSRSLTEVLRGGEMNKDTGKDVADLGRDRPGKREGEICLGCHSDDHGWNTRGG
jgi:hypothetical protein